MLQGMQYCHAKYEHPLFSQNEFSLNVQRGLTAVGGSDLYHRDYDVLNYLPIKFSLFQLK